jgi:hypothetical protein
MGISIIEAAAALAAAHRSDTPPLKAREAVAVAGSWDPDGDTAGTAQFTIGDVYATIDDGTDDYEQAFPIRAHLGVSHWGFQYGPIGGERYMLVHTQSGYLAIPHHDIDDSPGAPSGESWLTHKNPTAAQNDPGVDPDAYVKLTNDGAVQGDALGGLMMLAGSLLSQQTAGGHSITADDNLQQVEIQSAGGHSVLLDDQNEQIVITSAGGLTITLDDQSGEVWLNGESLTDQDGVVRMSDLQDAITALAALCQPGSGVPPPTVTASTTVLSAA